MILVQAIFTILAWRKGWGPWALLPMAFALLVGVVVGISTGGAGISKELLVLAFVGDLSVATMLIAMSRRAPSRRESRIAPEGPVEVVLGQGESLVTASASDR